MPLPPILLFVSCNAPVLRHGYMTYRVIRKGWGDKAKYGQIMKLQVKQLYLNPREKDSLLSDPRSRFPEYQQIDSAGSRMKR